MRILNQGCAIIESDGGLSLFSFASRPTSQLTVWQHTIGLKYDRNIEIYIYTYVCRQKYKYEINESSLSSYVSIKCVAVYNSWFEIQQKYRYIDTF